MSYILSVDKLSYILSVDKLSYMLSVDKLSYILSVDFLQALGWKLAEYGDSLQSLVTMHLAWKQIHSIKRHHMSRENFFELP